MQQAENAIGPRQADERFRALAFIIDDDVPIPVSSIVCEKRRLDEKVPVLPVPCRQRQVVFLDHALTKFFVQFTKCATSFRENQTTRCLAIEPVHQRQVLQIGARCPEQLYDAVTDATATVHRHAGRLVDNEQTLVFEYGALQHVGGRLIGRRRPRRVYAYRRDANHIAGLKLVLRFDAPAIDPNLAFSQETINPALGYPRQQIAQIIVDSLASEFLADTDFAHARTHGIWGFLWLHNDLFHVARLGCCVILPTCEGIGTRYLASQLANRDLLHL